MRGKYPGEDINFSQPLAGVEIMTVSNSPRYWRAFLEQYGVCTPQPKNVGFSVNRYRHRELSCGNGATLLFEPGETNIVKKLTGPGNFWMLSIAPKLLNETAQEFGLTGEVHFNPVQMDDTRINTALVEFHKAMEQTPTLLDVQCKFQNCLELLIGNYGEGPMPARPHRPNRVKLTRTREFIEENFEKKIALDELAEIAGLGRHHFCRAFRELFGLPPNQFQHAVRIARARKMLAEGSRPTFVAQEVGYGDLSHMLRHFKPLLGVSPGRYQQLLINTTPEED